MAAVSDYGSTFTFNGSSIGKCIVVGFPEVSDGGVETTNHSGVGYAESIPSGLKRIGDLTLSVLNESGVYSALRTLQNNKTVATAVVGNGIDTITGSGWIKSVKGEDADATDPKANSLTVVVACTGSWS
jgi:hypothetical protein